MHTGSTPRIGGIAIMVAACSAYILATGERTPLYLSPLFIGALALIFGVSAWDDAYEAPVIVRLLCQVLAAIAICVWLKDASAAHLPHVLLSDNLHLLFMIGLGVFVIVWSVNLFNFMDGANGLLGHASAIGFVALAICATLTSESDGVASYIAMISITTAGAILGFLPFNFPTARVFMGDSGSVTLGTLAATIGIQGWLMDIWPWWFAPLAFSPLIVDASVTLLKRLYSRQPILKPHRAHYYQRLILTLGWSHTQTTLAYTALALITSASGIGVIVATKADQSRDWLHLFLPALWVVKYTLLLIYMERRFSINQALEKQ